MMAEMKKKWSYIKADIKEILYFNNKYVYVQYGKFEIPQKGYKFRLVYYCLLLFPAIVKQWKRRYEGYVKLGPSCV